jgi:hypothetical protein
MIITPLPENGPRGALSELEALLQAQDNDESKYQELIRDHPWILGMQHKDAQRHTALDEANIPDFTGVRTRDSARDIFEIKPPFTQVVRRNGNLTQPFNDAYAQAERYLVFAREQRQCLRDKGLRFDSPICYLIIGYGLSNEQMQAIRRKEQLNPAIQILTYDDLLAFVRNTIDVVKGLKADEAPAEPPEVRESAEGAAAEGAGG